MCALNSSSSSNRRCLCAHSRFLWISFFFRLQCKHKKEFLVMIVHFFPFAAHRKLNMEFNRYEGAQNIFRWTVPISFGFCCLQFTHAHFRQIRSSSERLKLFSFLLGELMIKSFVNYNSFDAVDFKKVFFFWVCVCALVHNHLGTRVAKVGVQSH